MGEGIQIYHTTNLNFHVIVTKEFINQTDDSNLGESIIIFIQEMGGL